MQHAELKKSFRERGYRLTPQRSKILEIVHDAKNHISAEDILNQVQPLYPEVSISTVYRTLELLTELDLMAPIQTGDGYTRYHFVHEGEQGHHHLICKRCGSVIDVHDDIFLEVTDQLSRDYKFQASFIHTAINGICALCNTQSGNDLSGEA